MLNVIQLEARKTGLGASDAATILGLNPYKTAYQFWLERTGREMPEDLSKNKSVILGTLMEEPIAKFYEMETGKKLARVNLTQRHKDFPHILCHLDRRVVGEDKIIEIKTANTFAGKDWGHTGSDIAPLQYLVQLNYQMEIRDCEEGELVVLIGSNDFRIINIKRDREMGHAIVEQVNHFWQHNILNDNAPEAVTRQDLDKMFPSNNGDMKLAEFADILAVSDYLKHSKISKDALEEKAKCAVEICKAIGIADGLVNDQGNAIVTYKAMKNGKRQLRVLGE